MNPEFKKQIWLEMSWHRLLFTPIFIALTLYLSHLVNNGEGMRSLSVWIYFFVTIIGGVRQAQSTIFDEVQDATWVTMKLSALSPWQIVCGKLFGGLSFIWYISALPVVLMLLHSLLMPNLKSWLVFQQGFLIGSILILITPLVLHALAFSFALIDVEHNPAPNKLSTLFTTIFAFIFGLWWIHLLSAGSSIYAVTSWYNLTLHPISVYLITVLSFGSFAIISACYLMRRALNMNNFPFIWLLFLTWVYLFVLGFNSTAIEMRVTFSLLALYVFAYLNIMLEKHSLLDVKRLQNVFKKFEIKNILIHIPRWCLSIFALMLATIIYVLVVPKEFTSFQSPNFNIKLDQGLNFHNSAIAAFMFFLRDTALFQLFHIFRKYKRSTLAGIFYLILLYWIIPGILSILHVHKDILAIVVPINGTSIISGIIQTTVLWGILINKLK